MFNNEKKRDNAMILEFINSYSVYSLQSNNVVLDMQSVLSKFKNELPNFAPNFVRQRKRGKTEKDP